MKQTAKYIGLGMILLAVVLVFTKPTEADFFDQIVTEYSQIHPEFKLTAENLKEMGNTRYSSFVVYSSYAYQFGNIEVHYLGIFGGIYSLGYQNEHDKIESKESAPITL